MPPCLCMHAHQQGHEDLAAGAADLEAALARLRWTGQGTQPAVVVVGGGSRESARPRVWGVGVLQKEEGACTLTRARRQHDGKLLLVP